MSVRTYDASGRVIAAKGVCVRVSDAVCVTGVEVAPSLIVISTVREPPTLGSLETNATPLMIVCAASRVSEPPLILSVFVASTQSTVAPTDLAALAAVCVSRRVSFAALFVAIRAVISESVSLSTSESIAAGARAAAPKPPT